MLLVQRGKRAHHVRKPLGRWWRDAKKTCDNCVTFNRVVAPGGSLWAWARRIGRIDLNAMGHTSKSDRHAMTQAWRECGCMSVAQADTPTE